MGMLEYDIFFCKYTVSGHNCLPPCGVAFKLLLLFFVVVFLLLFFVVVVFFLFVFCCCFFLHFLKKTSIHHPTKRRLNIKEKCNNQTNLMSFAI